MRIHRNDCQKGEIQLKGRFLSRIAQLFTSSDKTAGNHGKIPVHFLMPHQGIFMWTSVVKV